VLILLFASITAAASTKSYTGTLSVGYYIKEYINNAYIISAKSNMIY